MTYGIANRLFPQCLSQSDFVQREKGDGPPSADVEGGHRRHHGDRFTPRAGTLPTIAPSNLTPAEKYRYYANLVVKNGGEVDDKHATVLGLRGLAPDGARHDSNENVGPYNDTFVVLKHDAAGQPEAIELLGQTHSGQKSGPNSGGVAQIQPGSYKAEPNGPHHNMPSWHVETLSGSGEIPCWRDANKNGYIDPAEKQSPTVATAILFHTGVNTDHGSSIGCQVMRPDVYKDFVQDVGEQNELYYTLVDANRPTPGSRSGGHHHSRHF